MDADENIRIERARTRGWTPEQLQARENNQLDIAEKKRRSTRFILNNGTLTELNETISTLWSSLLKRHSPASDTQHCPENTGPKTLP